jgi:hypothetical protein
MKLEEIQVGKRYLIKMRSDVFEVVVIEITKRAVKWRYVLSGNLSWITEADMYWYKIFEELPNIEPNPERSVATKLNSSTDDGNQNDNQITN